MRLIALILLLVMAVAWGCGESPLAPETTAPLEESVVVEKEATPDTTALDSVSTKDYASRYSLGAGMWEWWLVDGF